MLFTFTISNEFDSYKQFICDADDIIDATMKADAIVKQLDEKLDAAFPERDKESSTMVREIALSNLDIADEKNINKYVEEMKESFVFDDDDD